MFRFRKKIITLLVCAGIFAVATFAFAQPDLGLNEFGAQTALGTKPLGQTIAEIVRIFLGVLGTIAVILLLYAGFLWMTAAGDAEKIATAKKLIINAVIGLAIILASLTITQFIIGALEKATGSNIGGGGEGPGGGGGLPSDSFTVKGISPQGSIPIRNVVVRVALSHTPDNITINGNILVIKKSDASIAPMNFAVSNNTVELTSSVSCPPPNAGIKCLEENTAYKIEVKTGLKDTGGKNLICGGLAPNCTAEFTTGSLVDTAPPQVAITYPDPGQSVSQNSFVNVWAHATDDSAVSHIEFFADGAYFDKDFPPGASQPGFDGKVLWDTTGVARGSHNLTAKAYDIDSNNVFSPALNVIVRAEHCFNGAKDVDETAIDCGGADCATCTGGTCQANGDCASGSCQNGICVDMPLILGVSPLDGAPGIYVTISGKYFGATPGTVTFLGGAGTADDKVAGLAPCSGAWSTEQVVVVVPQGITTNGPIEIKNSIGSDTTDNARGPVLPNFIISPTLRPGICALTPNEGKSGITFTIAGTEFGANQGTSFIKFGNAYAVPQSWSNAAIFALVPVLSAGDNSVRVNRNGVDSNAVTFTVLSLTSGTKPTINYVNPDKGPAGEYITLFGSNFGEAAGVVQFVRSDGTVALGDTNFPQICAAVNYWHNGYVTVKVPDKFSDGSSTKNITTSLRLRRSDNEISNVISFPINSDTPKPGICGLKPDNGPIGTPVDILGERFGAAGTVAFYNNVGSAAVWGSEMIQTAVPTGAVSGPVKITVAGKDSNSVNFSIGDCSKTPGLCTVDQQCCAASCISKTQECQAVPKEGAYAWRISTGIIPKVPRVIEDCSTGEKAANPSPSPWDSRPGGNTACINAIVDIRFDSKLDPATVLMSGVAGDTITLSKCTGGASNPCAVKTKVALDLVYSKIYSVSTSEDGIQMYPAGGKLEKDVQYLVELTTKIRGAGAGGGYMEEKVECGIGNSYCFKFKTINSDGLCKVGSLVTSPQEYTSDKKELLEYISSPRAKDDVCLNINASAYTYAWSSSQPGHASINKIGFNLAGQPVQNEAIIESLSETNLNDPAIITSAILAENVSGKANLTIKFADPVVITKWPSCTTACVNSTIGAQFNVDMDAATLIPANIEVWKCKTENCDSFDGTLAGGIGYNTTNKSFTFTPSASLEISRYYLVRLDAQKIRSTSGVGLTGANDGKYFSWQFKTRADTTPCTVNKVNVNPLSQTYNYIGQIAEFNSEPVGAPDNCSPVGQKLNPYAYGWTWKSADAAIVSLLNNGSYNVLPPAGVGCSDRCLRTGSSPGVSVCGNGKLEKGEDCDDSNAKNGDGCSDRCLAEGAAIACGNSVIDKGESCDDSNKKSGDGCSDVCLAEGSKAGKSICGNGDKGKGETCDDGNALSGDGCSNDCLNEGTSAGIASCGNGVVESNLGEDCDDSNTKNGDGCSEFCKNEGSIAGGSICGNGKIENGEDCDDGNTVSGDGCSLICLNEGSSLQYKPAGSICGDGAVDIGESCDNASADGNVDPRQYASAVNKGVTQISTATAGVTGKSNVEVLCIYTTDAQCQALDATLGVGKDNCCWFKPQVKKTIPALNESNVCRNTLISAAYDQLMDGAAGEISIDQKKNGNCPSGSAVSTDGLWCEGAIKATRQVYDDIINKQTTFNWTISNVLASNTIYRVKLSNFKNKGGVTATAVYVWTFTSGNDICKVDKVNIVPDSMTFYSVKPDQNPRQAKAEAISFNNGKESPIVSIPGIYAWTWEWDTSPEKYITLAPLASPDKISVTALPKNGEETLSAIARITDDKFNISIEKTVIGTANVIVFLCEHPWPDLYNFPLNINTYANVSTYYCRDNTPNLLPDLKKISVAGSGEIVEEYLFTNTATGDAVGMRVYQNPNHLSPLSWYKSKLFVGTPSASHVDGYEAIVDGRTTYVNAANVSGGANYTNLFVISYSQGAPPEMQNIYKQILDNWKFNTNLTNVEKCAVTGAACTGDLDCATGACLADKDKIRKDTKRLADLNDIATMLESYKTINNSYPQILSGSFLRGRSVSVWPSWQSALGNDLGKALAVDPVNKHAACTGAAYSGYDSTTCWNGAIGQYVCPAGSRVYNYRNIAQDSYRLGGDLEYGLGAGWSGINSNFTIQGFCSGVAEGTSAKCGDGVVGTGEECEKGNTTLESCTMSGGKSGNKKLTCATNCTWDRSAACQAGQCGDGTKQGSEVCDDGQNNGKYGYCNTSCGGLAAHCGDPNVDAPYEQCDLGAANGQYNKDSNASCSWDCKKPGPSCGDKIVQSNEQCDGNSETSKEVRGLPACTVQNGYETQRTRNCTASCTWDVWSDCKPAGTCSNGIKEGTEECDTASGTSGGCVMDPIKNYMCKTATCGDGYVWTSKEACDNSILNGKECNAPYGLTCNYCGTSCNVITKTGPYCGDKVKDFFSPEECDDKNFGGLTCANFGFLHFFSGTWVNKDNLTCNSNCKALTENCKSAIRVNAGHSTGYIEEDGKAWVSDVYFLDGGTWPAAEIAYNIFNTSNQKVYKSGRYASPTSDLHYSFPTGPGTYKVRLHFAQIFGDPAQNNYPGKGTSVFNIVMEGKTFLSNIDIMDAAKGGAGAPNTAVVKEFTVPVSDTNLDITLQSVVGGTAISGLEIESSNSNGSDYSEGGVVVVGSFITPPACTNQCTAGATQCSGTSGYQTCVTGSNGCTVWNGMFTYCVSGTTCSGGQCVTTAPPPPSCTPDCRGKSCGDNGCGGSCGACSGSQICQSGTCVASCTPSCTGKTCGDNGCGGSCGSCSGQYVCSGSQCVCVPKTCADVGFVCGSLANGCGGAMYCGGCRGGYSCWGTACCSNSTQACGTYTDSCGHTYQVGGCSSPYICVGTTCRLP